MGSQHKIEGDNRMKRMQIDMNEVLRLLIKEYGYEEVRKELERQGISKVKVYEISDEEEPKVEEESKEEVYEERDTATLKEGRVYKIKSAEEIKKEREEHLGAIKAKRKELRKKGICSESLLTKENMEKWLGKGMSYNRIAREEVGLSEKVVSSKAKEYGLTSAVGRIIRLRHAGVF
jgi:hypothetical protein